MKPCKIKEIKTFPLLFLAFFLTEFTVVQAQAIKPLSNYYEDILHSKPGK